MREDLDRKLCEDFPLLYRDRNGDPRYTNMCWGFPGNGWYALLRRLSEKLEAAILALPEEQRPLYRAAQVKEKFGTLRFYMTHETPEMTAWIGEAETESGCTCETCGEPGEPCAHGGWVYTACEAHDRP